MRSVIGSAALLVVLAATAADAQEAPRRFTLEGRGGFNVPTFDISDAVDGGPSVGVGLVPALAQAVGAGRRGSGLPLRRGRRGRAWPDVKVYHYIAKLGYAVVPEGASKWSVIVNAGAGAMTFDVDGGTLEHLSGHQRRGEDRLPARFPVQSAPEPAG